MSELVKATLVLGTFILMATGISLYFSPYQSCVRSIVAARGIPATIDPSKPDFSDLAVPTEVETEEYKYAAAAKSCAAKLGRN